jgi:SAM-dependent methyltransferase
MSDALEKQYKQKPARYYAESRPEMLPYIPASARVILDVGCSTGLFGAAIKERQTCEVWGVEMFAEAAAAAHERLDRVIHSAFSEELDLPSAHFDCIIFNDCLEHLAVPEEALRLARTLLRNDGVIVSSIPNMRYFPVIYSAALGGSTLIPECWIGRTCASSPSLVFQALSSELGCRWSDWKGSTHSFGEAVPASAY